MVSVNTNPSFVSTDKYLRVSPGHLCAGYHSNTEILMTFFVCCVAIPQVSYSADKHWKCSPKYLSYTRVCSVTSKFTILAETLLVYFQGKNGNLATDILPSGAVFSCLATNEGCELFFSITKSQIHGNTRPDQIFKSLVYLCFMFTFSSSDFIFNSVTIIQYIWINCDIQSQCWA